MKTSTLIAALLFAGLLAGQSQLVLNEGDTYTFGVDALPLIYSAPGTVDDVHFRGSFTLDASSIQPGDMFRIELMEGDTITRFWNGPGSTESFVFTGNFSGHGFMRFTGLSGSVTLDSVYMENHVLPDFNLPGGQNNRVMNHYAGYVLAPPASVPEPGTVGLLGLCVVLGRMIQRVRKRDADS